MTKYARRLLQKSNVSHNTSAIHCTAQLTTCTSGLEEMGCFSGSQLFHQLNVFLVSPQAVDKRKGHKASVLYTNKMTSKTKYIPQADPVILLTIRNMDTFFQHYVLPSHRKTVNFVSKDHNCLHSSKRVQSVSICQVH